MDRILYRLACPAGRRGPAQRARRGIIFAAKRGLLCCIAEWWRGAMIDRVPGSAAGQLVTSAYTNAAGARQYQLYVPGGAAGQALPLVVMLHGCGQAAAEL